MCHKQVANKSETCGKQITNESQTNHNEVRNESQTNHKQVVFVRGNKYHISIQVIMNIYEVPNKLLNEKQFHFALQLCTIQLENLSIRTGGLWSPPNYYQLQMSNATQN